MKENIVYHKFIGPKDMELYVIEMVKNDEKYPESSQYRCRYFANGEFKETVFFQHELDLTT